MKLKEIAHRREIQPQLHGNRKFDPLLAAKSEAGKFNAAWLKNGESLTLLQRIGFAVFSLFFVGAGLYLLSPAVLSLREGDIVFFGIFAASSAYFLFVCVLGLRNVLQFRPRERRDDIH